MEFRLYNNPPLLYTQIRMVRERICPFPTWDLFEAHMNFCNLLDPRDVNTIPLTLSNTILSIRI